MKALILGATGLLGQALMREWSRDEVVGLGVDDVDIRDSAKVREVIEKRRPEWIVLAAAYTDVDGCESNQELAFSVNRDGAVQVARAAKNAGAKLMFLSSDYVFDGKKTAPYEIGDPRNPQSVYGRSKAEAEIQLLERYSDVLHRAHCLAVRNGRQMFPRYNSEARGHPARARCSQRSAGMPNVFRRSGAGDRSIVPQECERNCARDQCGRLFVVRVRARNRQVRQGFPREVRPVSTQQMVRPAPRPTYSVMSGKSLTDQGIVMPTWRDALERYLQERGS